VRASALHPSTELRLLQRTSGPRCRLVRASLPPCKHGFRDTLTHQRASHEVLRPTALEACGGCHGPEYHTEPSGACRVSHPRDAFISAASPPALFHAGSALGLHPSELSPLKQPAHLSVLRALLTLTRHRLVRRPARPPLLNIEFTTIPLQRLRPRAFQRPGPKPGTPSATVLHRHRVARGPGSARSTAAAWSGSPAHHLPGTEVPFQRPAGAPGRCRTPFTAPPSPKGRHRGFQGLSRLHARPRDLWQRPEGHHRRSTGSRLGRLPEGKPPPRPLSRFHEMPGSTRFRDQSSRFVPPSVRTVFLRCQRAASDQAIFRLRTEAGPPSRLQST
jgi:hypothetical protein